MRFMCVIQKKTKRPITGSLVQNDLMKKIKITNLLTKRFFRRNIKFGNMMLLLFNYQVKNTVPSVADTCVWKKLQNLTKRYFSKKYDL